MRKDVILSATVLLCAAAVTSRAGNQIGKGPMINWPLLNGAQAVNSTAVAQTAGVLPQTDEVAVIGDTVTIGTTWYEIQHNGTIGRMVVKDSSGYLHFVWTNGLDAASASRHVYYNYIDAAGNQGWPGTGAQVDSADRAGFTCLAVAGNGNPFPAFHQVAGLSLINHSAVAAPAGVLFQTFELPWFQGQDLPFIWPRICLKWDGEMLIVSTESMSTPSDPMPQTWCLGTYDGLSISYTAQELLEYTMTAAAEVAASRISNRVAAAWTTGRDAGFPNGSPTQYNNDIHMMIDDDGQNLNFGNWFNLTDFIYPDTTQPDTLLMNGDTLRAYTDISLFFDLNDYCHAAFTTLGFYQLDSLITLSASLIWHWSEEFPNEFALVANHWYNAPQPGVWNRNCQRPSLGLDPATGHLYCMYQVYDSSTVAASGYPSGEVHVSVSMDGGRNWSVGTNVTNTVSPNGAAAGQCLSELCPSMAEVVEGYCHIIYVLDLDAGNSKQQQPEGISTLNSVKYHRVPVDSIATEPLVPQWPEPGSVPFHVQHLPDTTQVSLAPKTAPAAFALAQNTPNPFNPTTVLRYELREASLVKLEVYDVSGRLVQTLANGWRSAGAHEITFGRSNLAAGIYIYRLQAGSFHASRKMVLMK